MDLSSKRLSCTRATCNNVKTNSIRIRVLTLCVSADILVTPGRRKSKGFIGYPAFSMNGKMNPPKQQSTWTGTWYVLPKAAICSIPSIIPWGNWGAEPTSYIISRELLTSWHRAKIEPSPCKSVNRLHLSWPEDPPDMSKCRPRSAVYGFPNTQQPEKLKCRKAFDYKETKVCKNKMRILGSKIFGAPRTHLT